MQGIIMKKVVNKKMDAIEFSGRYDERNNVSTVLE